MAGETFFVHFLGTAGALPTPQRNTSCIMVRRGSDTLLFDCGEGAQQQMMRARTGFTVDAVFITHWHADHFLGIFGLLETLGFMGRTEPLRVYGPEWVREFCAAVHQISRNHKRFPLVAIPLSHGDEVVFGGYRVRAFATDHGIASLGYILVEDDRPGRFDRERAIALGVPPGPLFGRLQHGEHVQVERDGRLLFVEPAEVMGPPRPGRKMVYTGDTRPGCEGWEEWGEGADLLIHDATFDDAEGARAAEVFHSTAGEAAAVAARLSACALALMHISSRYSTTANHIRDAKKQFSGEVFVPDDLSMRELFYRG
ncbi:MAG: ribonuclease Z [Methanomicrobiaceae archaeon]|nr:ribonuclease Z [Methanomicrobiaceae archaeon]